MRTNGLAKDANGEVEGGAGVPQRDAPRPAAAPGPKRSSLLSSLAFTGLVTLTAGCSGVATLQSVLRPDGADATVEDIQVFRNGTPVTPELSMGLVSGDEIQTEADSTAIIRFADGTEVIVGPNTRIRIGSLWVLFGEIYVKARGLFRVETLYVTAGVEGTEYLLTVDSEAEMNMVVLEGAVRLTSKTGSWEPIALRKFEQGVFRPQEIPLTSRVDPTQGNRIMQAINQPVPQILAPARPAATPAPRPPTIQQEKPVLQAPAGSGPKVLQPTPAPGPKVLQPAPPPTEGFKPVPPTERFKPVPPTEGFKPVPPPTEGFKPVPPTERFKPVPPPTEGFKPVPPTERFKPIEVPTQKVQPRPAAGPTRLQTVPAPKLLEPPPRGTGFGATPTSPR